MSTPITHSETSDRIEGITDIFQGATIALAGVLALLTVAATAII